MNASSAGSLPPRDRIRLPDTIGGGNRAFCVPRFDGVITINMRPESFDNPRVHKLDKGRAYGEVLIHELVHAWQIHNAPMEEALLADALAAKICELQEIDLYEYGPPGPPFHDFLLEQQGNIVSDWFRTCHVNTPGQPHGLDRSEAINDPYFRYVNGNIRTAVW